MLIVNLLHFDAVSLSVGLWKSSEIGEIVYLRGGFLVGEWSERIAFQYVSDADRSSPIIQEHGANP